MQQGIVEHAISGRMRLRFRSHRGDTAFFRQLVEVLKGQPTVTSVEANPATGGVLVLHTGSGRELAALASRSAGLQVAPPRPRPQKSLLASLASRGRHWRPSWPVLSFVGLALYQLARGRALGTASEQFWHATRAREMNQPGLGIALICVGMFQLFSGRLLAPASSLLMYALMSEAATARSMAAQTPIEQPPGGFSESDNA
jgi:hypothetical protein